MRTTEEILSWIAKERDYQRLINRNAKRIPAEIEFAQELLDQARADYDPSASPYRQRACLKNLRRISANFVRCLEKFGMPDQDMQKVRDCTVKITRGEGE
jgi:hypothetical protein